MRHPDEQPGLVTAQVERLLRERYVGEHFALVFGVRNDAGFAATRTADALGIGLWPSRGCELTGFEIKCSRGDWLAELKKPEKAEAFHAYCDAWYLVTGHHDIVRQGELPVGWGLLVPTKDGKKLRQVVAPARNEKPKPMPRGMLAAFIKRAATQAPNEEMLAAAFARGEVAGKAAADRRADLEKYNRDAQQKTLERIKQFTQRTGIDPEWFSDTETLKRAYELVRRGGLVELVHRADQSLDFLTRQVGEIRSQVQRLAQLDPP